MPSLRTLCLLIIGLLMWNGCSDIGTNPAQAIQTDKGTVSLSLSKQAVPVGIEWICIELSRSDGMIRDSARVSMANDTLRFLLSEVPVGRWLLSVTAKDGENRAKYVGQSLVDVFQDETTIVNVYMNVISGTGTVEINIIWGTQQKKWCMNANNPILSQSSDSWDAGHFFITHPVVLQVGGQYWMYYTSGNNDYDTSSPGLFTCRATSVDGIHWTKNGPITINVSQLPWASKGINGHAVLIENTGEKKMWFQGRTNLSDGSGIGYATSADGLNWTTASDPVIAPSPDRPVVISPAIVKHEGNYYLYYAVQWNYSGRIHQEIYLSTSLNGTTWIDRGPVLKPRQNVPWETSGVSRPFVIYDENKFKMFYTATYFSNVGYASVIGYAESRDGVVWYALSLEPELGTKDTNPWQTSMTGHGSVVRDGNGLRIWFAGLSVGANKWQIGTADRP